MEILIVVDMQNDFIHGALGTSEAQAILPQVVEKCKNWKGEILFTRDTHDNDYLNTLEGKNLPVPHCIKGTEGWEIHPDLSPWISGKPLDKPNFGSLALPETLKQIIGNTPEQEVSITLIGLCTDICVLSNAIILKPAFPEAQIQVDASCCAGVTPESHQNALSAMTICQIKIV